MRTPTNGDKGLLLVLAAALGVLAALVPLARAVDERADRRRPLYADVDRMLEFQARLVAANDEGMAVSLQPGESVAVGDERFTASDGVRLRVVLGPDAGYCVWAGNDHGDATRWQCTERMTPPGGED